MPCFFAPEMNEADKSLKITGDEYHHIAKVFRKEVGDVIPVTNGKGIMAEAVITHLMDGFLQVRLEKIDEIPPSKPRLAVAFALLKNKNDMFVVEKLTELGVKEFFPFTSVRTIRRSTPRTRQKFEKIAISAIKQCDNAWLPEIHKPMGLKLVLDALLFKGYQPLIAYENEDSTRMIDILPQMSGNICLVIGPEGGFSPDEAVLFMDKNMSTFTLGNHVLRAETAAIAGSAIIIGKFLESNRDYY